MSRKFWIPVAVAVLVAMVVGGTWFFANRTDDADSVARTQQFQTSTTATTSIASVASSTAPMPSVSASVDTSSPMVPHLQPGQELPPTPIMGLNFPIDGVEWSIMEPMEDPADSMDGGLNRMTKVNRVPIAGSDCAPSKTTRLCAGFIVVSTDQSPFYAEKGCLTVAGPTDPTYQFSRRLDDVRINGMVVERVQMARCGAPGASFVWQFPLKNGTKVDVIEIGNDSAQPSNPLKGLPELLDKVTLVG